MLDSESEAEGAGNQELQDSSGVPITDSESLAWESNIYEAQGEEVVENAETGPTYGPARGTDKERGGDGSTPVNPRVRALRQNREAVPFSEVPMSPNAIATAKTDRLKPRYDDLGRPMTKSGRQAQQCVGCLGYYEKSGRGIEVHYNTCKPFVKWRRQWIDLNVSDIPTNNGSEEELDLVGAAANLGGPGGV